MCQFASVAAEARAGVAAIAMPASADAIKALDDIMYLSPRLRSPQSVRALSDAVGHEAVSMVKVQGSTPHAGRRRDADLRAGPALPEQQPGATWVPGAGTG